MMWRRRSTGAGAMLVLLASAAAAFAGQGTTPRVPVDAPSQRVPATGFSYTGPRIQGGAAVGMAPAGTRGLTLDGVPIPVASDGRFLIAFDRDARTSAVLVATLAGGREIRDVLHIAPRAWRIERLNTLPRFSLPSAEFERRRPAELAQIRAARRIASDAQGWRQPLLWPAIGRISGLFGSQRIYKNGEAGAYHSGVDVAGRTGTIVLAPADGVVVLAADHPFTLEGNLLMIDHGMGLNSAFLHLSRIDVVPGARVRRGQPVGAIGMTGRATGAHLHWSMKWRDARIDPLLVAGPMPAAQ